MHDLAVLLRAMQLFAHSAHNLASGPTFFADHAHLGTLYETYEEAYDAVIERMIGLGDDKPDICGANLKAAEMASKFDCCPPAVAFSTILDMEKELCDCCKECQKGQSIGTVNFLQGLADDSEQRQYLIGQRVK